MVIEQNYALLWLPDWTVARVVGARPTAGSLFSSIDDGLYIGTEHYSLRSWSAAVLEAFFPQCVEQYLSGVEFYFFAGSQGLAFSEIAGATGRHFVWNIVQINFRDVQDSARAESFLNPLEYFPFFGALLQYFPPVLNILLEANSWKIFLLVYSPSSSTSPTPTYLTLYLHNIPLLIVHEFTGYWFFVSGLGSRRVPNEAIRASEGLETPVRFLRGVEAVCDVPWPAKLKFPGAKDLAELNIASFLERVVTWHRLEVDIQFFSAEGCVRHACAFPGSFLIGEGSRSLVFLIESRWKRVAEIFWHFFLGSSLKEFKFYWVV